MIRRFNLAVVLLLACTMLGAAPPGADSNVQSAVGAVGSPESIGSWVQVASPTNADLTSVAVVSTTDAWAVGANGTIIHWDGKAWRIVPSGTTELLLSVTMASATDGWVVGAGTILHWDGHNWIAPVFDDWRELTDIFLYTVAVVAPNEIWLFGRSTYLWDGTSASPREIEGLDSIMSVAMLSWDKGFAVSGMGDIWYWNGRAWTAVASPTKDGIVSLSLSSDKEGWAVGGRSVLSWYKGGWGVYPYYPFAVETGSPAAVDMVSENDGWAVGHHIAHWNGQQWQKVIAYVSPKLQAVMMLSPADGWAVGRAGQIMHYTTTPSLNYVPAASK